MANVYARDIARNNGTPIQARDVIARDILSVRTIDGAGMAPHRVSTAEHTPSGVRITLYNGRVIEPSHRMAIGWHALASN